MSESIKHVAALPFSFKATFRWHPEHGGIAVESTPQVPRFTSRRAFKKFREAYDQARHEFLIDVATAMGGNILVADVDGATPCDPDRAVNQ